MHIGTTHWSLVYNYDWCMQVHGGLDVWPVYTMCRQTNKFLCPQIDCRHTSVSASKMTRHWAYVHQWPMKKTTNAYWKPSTVTIPKLTQLSNDVGAVECDMEDVKPNVQGNPIMVSYLELHTVSRMFSEILLFRRTRTWLEMFLCMITRRRLKLKKISNRECWFEIFKFLLKFTKVCIYG